MIIDPCIEYYENSSAWKASFNLHAPYMLQRCEYNDLLWRVLNVRRRPVGISTSPVQHTPRTLRPLYTHDISLHHRDTSMLESGSVLIDDRMHKVYYFWSDLRPSVFRDDWARYIVRLERFLSTRS